MSNQIVSISFDKGFIPMKTRVILEHLIKDTEELAHASKNYDVYSQYRSIVRSFGMWYIDRYHRGGSLDYNLVLKLLKARLSAMLAEKRKVERVHLVPVCCDKGKIINVEV